MTRNAFALLGATALAAGCGRFVAPKVQCDGITLHYEATLKPPRPDVGCDIPEAVSYVVSHAPRVDPAFTEETGVTDESLVTTQVTVTQGSGAVLLCPGVDCTPSATAITLPIGSAGVLSYRVVINLEAAGATPGPGGDVTWKGVAVTETYGAGNSCPINVDMHIACGEPLN